MMTPKQRDKVALAIAPLVFAFTDAPLTPKGIQAVKDQGFKWLTKKEIEGLRLIAVEAAKAMEAA